MPNLNDLSKFLKRDDIKAGDILTFMDAGEIKEVDFSRAKDGSNLKTVFQITVKLPDSRGKIATINKTSQDSLSAVYGKDTSAWVGKQAKVSFVEQLAFGKLIEVLILKPINKEVSPANGSSQEGQGDTGPITNTPGWAKEILEEG